jgi:galactitol-specific phosphotransferase system IIC component
MKENIVNIEVSGLFKDKRGSPVVEEGLLIGIAIVGILIFIGLIFGLFDWINEALSSLFDSFNL